jgi:hypothetical protein
MHEPGDCTGGTKWVAGVVAKDGKRILYVTPPHDTPEQAMADARRWAKANT